jgi:hypothetical protein
MPQFGAVIEGLPWKLIEPVNDKTHGLASTWTLAMACAPMLTVDRPSTPARYAGCVCVTVARTKVPLAEVVQDPAAKLPMSMLTACDVPVDGVVQREPG